MSEESNKYGSLCSHDFHKSLTNEVELPCINRPELTHRISQFGKICNKCTHIIKDSYKHEKSCIVCADSIQQYLADRELCQHENREFEDINIKCINEPSNTHEVPFKKAVCKRCSDKLRAAFMYCKTCKVCEGQEDDVIRDMEKVFISPAYSHFQNIISILKQAKANDQVFKNQIESACKAEPKVTRQENGVVPNKLVEEYDSSDREDSHQSKRYKLYPKCRKHKESFINVCNLCLVALLNLDSCPYGCNQEEKVGVKVKKDVQIKTSETGFLLPYPMISKEGYYFELFVVKLIEERGRLDRWEINVKKVLPKTANELKYQDIFPLFAGIVGVGRRDFMVTGGVVGKKISEMTPTNKSFVITLSPDTKDFQIIELQPMHEPRSGHALIYHAARQMVFAIGGYLKGKGFSKTSEVYSIASREWYKLSDLNVERSKPCPVIYKDEVYVFGGLSANQSIYDVPGEKFNYTTQSWEKMVYSDFDFPSFISAVSTSSVFPPKEKENLFIFGGGNGFQQSSLIQSLHIKGNDYEMNNGGKFLKMIYPRTGCTLGLIGQDTLLVFGGLPEHQSFLSLDGIKLRIAEDEVSLLYVVDEIQSGSYRLSLRENASTTYKRLHDQLEAQGLISPNKLDNEEKTLTSAFNCQLLERLWYSIGKSFVWVPL